MKRSFIIPTVIALIFIFNGVGMAQLTQEQKQFSDKVLWPVFADIADNYPIQKIRGEFKLVGEESLKHRFYFILSSNDQMKILASAGIKDNKNIIVIFVPLAMKIFKEKGLEIFKDMMIIALLHEYYHVSHDLRLPDRKPEQLIQYESAAYWHECEELIGPMLKAGRLAGLPEQDFTLRLWRIFKKANGDKNDPVWRNFISSLVSSLVADFQKIEQTP